MGYLKLVAFAYEGGSRRASFDGLGGGGALLKDAWYCLGRRLSVLEQQDLI